MEHFSVLPSALPQGESLRRTYSSRSVFVVSLGANRIPEIIKVDESPKETRMSREVKGSKGK
jgi:hypothetical protein